MPRKMLGIGHGSFDSTFPAAAASGLVEFPTENLSFILGPQAPAGDGVTGTTESPWSYFDKVVHNETATLGANFPSKPPARPEWQAAGSGFDLNGTVSVVNGSTVATLSDATDLDYLAADPNIFLYIYEADGGAYSAARWRGPFEVTAINGLDLTLNATWDFASDTVAEFSTDVLYTYANEYTGSWQYYDLGLCLWQAYFRTGDTTYKSYAEKVAASWFLGRAIDSGAGDPTPAFSPRSVALGGLIVAALMQDHEGSGGGPGGQSLYWDWIELFTASKFQTWVYSRIGNASLHQGMRDGSYTLMYAAWVGRVLPDTYQCTRAHNSFTPGDTVTDGTTRRETLRDRALEAAANYTARLQAPAATTVDWSNGIRAAKIGAWYYDYGAATSETYLGNELNLTFHNGLGLEALIASHRLCLEHPSYIASDPAYVQYEEDIRNAILAGTEYLFKVCYRKGHIFPMDDASLPWRGMYYYTHTTTYPSDEETGTVSVTNGSDQIVGAGGMDFSRQMDAAATNAFIGVVTLTGTLTFTKDVLTVSGTGTTFTSEVAPGDILRFVDRQGRFYGVVVSTVDSDTQITLTYTPKFYPVSGLYAITEDTVSAEVVMLVEIASVEGATNATLSSTWTGSTASGLSFYASGNGSPQILSDPNSWRNVRQINSTACHAFGYAYKLSGNADFLTWGDEFFSSTFGYDGTGPGADGQRALQTAITNAGNRAGRTHNECYRAAGRYLGWRMGG